MIKEVADRRSLAFVIIKLLALLLAGSYIVYRFRSPVGNFIFYSFVFVSFIFSKRMIFWFSALFLVLNNPWGLFYYVPYEWYFPLTSRVGFSYVSIIGIVVTIKILYMIRKKQVIVKDFFKRYYRPFVFFAGFMLIWGLIYGYSLVSIYNLLQFFPALMIFFAVPRLMNRFQLDEFNNVIFLFSIIHFAGSLIEIISPGLFMQVIFFGPPPTGVAYETGLIRFVGGITIHLYSMFAALYYLSIKQNILKRWYLIVILILSYLFIVSSATRGWMIASTFLILSYFLYYFLRVKYSMKTIAGVIIVGAIIITVIPDSLKNNIVAAIDRLETMSAITEGDLTAEGTLGRLTVRGPIVLSVFRDSPVVGFGYSKVTADYFDEHIGNHSLLLMGGVTGLMVVWGTVLAILVFLFRNDIKNPGKGIFVFALAMIVIMIIHSTSRSMVSFYMPADSAFFMCLIFSHFNSIASSREEKAI